jgi:transcriptional regulator with XRE-family HTH domain
MPKRGRTKTARQEFDFGVARALVRLRTERGLTQLDVAHKSGLGRDFIGRVERGEQGLSLFAASKITQAIGVPLDAVTQEVQPGTAEPPEPPHMRLAMRRLRGMSPAGVHAVLSHVTYLEGLASARLSEPFAPNEERKAG